MGRTDLSAHGDEAQSPEAKTNINMECLMEAERVQCFVVMAADGPLGRTVSGAVRVLLPEGAESGKHISPELRPQDDWTNDYAKFKAFQFLYQALTDADNGQKWPRGLTDEESKLYRNGNFLVRESQVLQLCEPLHPNML